MREGRIPVGRRNPRPAAVRRRVLIWLPHSCARVASGSRHLQRRVGQASLAQLPSRRRRRRRGRVLPCGRRRKLVRPHGPPLRRQGSSRRSRHDQLQSVGESLRLHRARRVQMLVFERSHLVGGHLSEPQLRTSPRRDRRSPPPTTRRFDDRPRSESVKKPQLHHLTAERSEHAMSSCLGAVLADSVPSC